MILTLVRMDVDRWIVIRDEGYLETLQNKALRPASTRMGGIVFGPCAKSVAEKYVVKNNKLNNLEVVRNGN